MRRDDRPTHQGSCHCGRLQFRLRGAITLALDCNCSFCRRAGALWLPVQDADLEVVAGGEELVLYQFGTRTAQHYFCRHCGIAPFSRPRRDPNRWAVNARCIGDLDLSGLRIEPFDGASA
ncbi:MAG TPA: GFA family protein [Steroidobacteraceae bacterium]|nr:GFA family protein [Steroidobacteraceae bacterium]